MTADEAIDMAPSNAFMARRYEAAMDDRNPHDVSIRPSSPLANPQTLERGP